VTRRHESGVGAVVYVIAAGVVLAAAVFWYLQYTSSHAPQTLALSEEAKQYVRNLKLSEVGMKATESYLKQTVVEITGKIANTGDRTLQKVELYCVFYDAYGQLVLRERVPIVSPRTGALAPAQSQNFRLAFDTVPESWNRQMPQLVIAGIQFS
jgi:hypothetical protein